jgi:hypothetical protein
MTPEKLMEVADITPGSYPDFREVTPATSASEMTPPLPSTPVWPTPGWMCFEDDQGYRWRYRYTEDGVEAELHRPGDAGGEFRSIASRDGRRTWGSPGLLKKAVANNPLVFPNFRDVTRDG